MDKNLLRGRLVTAKELGVNPTDLDACPDIKKIPALCQRSKGHYCNRCFNQDQNRFARNHCSCAQDSCHYCLKCIQFGKVSSCQFLYHLEDTSTFPSKVGQCRWQGQLSDGQNRVAQEILQAYKAGQDHLVWAVTGAGKTEMLYPTITAALRQGHRVGIATPRIDVANELYLRLAEVFSDWETVLLHGQSEQSYAYTPLTICSTHQLLRFQAAFDLLVIDEIDAFPYRHNASLEQASQRALKANGTSLLLTATPSSDIQEKFQSQRSILPGRYHRHALPVPQHIWVGDWRSALAKGRVPRVLAYYIRHFASLKRRLLVFVPNIDLMLALEVICQKKFPHLKLTSVSSRDNDRQAKVNKMRDSDYDLLLTTQILERGVTFVGIDVIVLGSEDRTFTSAALVQIAGRVGRKPQAPNGRVLFLHYGQSRASRTAVRQIKAMNHLARKEGLIDD
ncbi:DEAD/DEAH box helicase [Aerococcus kribbianus]|uniref:Helicase-related protein n=1 Tax=Aerococcus kribbianus TaxID=2999064 RepID=A0A9X3FPC4_9LACT|nr:MULTISPECIES: DEAD/DEAH box helicase [unclassified Aerococcus]MCZ0717503.1 helicase-related protein [Aerococcus sp. YH-aer221]MCZ0725791.1 helicase-related protein [Aerococcus sp. YH-aer222]